MGDTYRKAVDGLNLEKKAHSREWRALNHMKEFHLIWKTMKKIGYVWAEKEVHDTNDASEFLVW